MSASSARCHIGGWQTRRSRGLNDGKYVPDRLLTKEPVVRPEITGKPSGTDLHHTRASVILYYLNHGPFYKEKGAQFLNHVQFVTFA